MMSEIAKQMRELRDEFKQGRWRQADYAAELFDCGADEIERLQDILDRVDAAKESEIERLQARVAKLEGYLDRLLNQCAGDHMTACEKTMGDSHPCTCGATEIRKALQETAN